MVILNHGEWLYSLQLFMIYFELKTIMIFQSEKEYDSVFQSENGLAIGWLASQQTTE